jgi:hypothetical protein
MKKANQLPDCFALPAPGGTEPVAEEATEDVTQPHSPAWLAKRRMPTFSRTVSPYPRRMVPSPSPKRQRRTSRNLIVRMASEAANADV